MRKTFILTMLTAMAFAMPAAAQQQVHTRPEPLKVKQLAKGNNPVKMKAARRNVPTADPAKYRNITFYANLINSDEWEGASIGSVPYGVYKFDIGGSKGFEPVSTSLLYTFMSAAYARDMVLGVRPMSVFGALTGVAYQALDTETYTQMWEKVYADNATYALISSVLAYDVTSDIVYSAQYNEDLTGMYWAKFNRNTRSFDILNKWNNDFQPLTMACTPDGRIFAIDANGYYYQIDKANGDASMLGETGVQPTGYIQQMAYEPTNGTFLWVAMTTSGAAIYEVDTETGAAALVRKLANNEQCAAVFLKTNAAKAKAPAAITDRDYAYSGNGATDGNITFTIPTTAYDGSTLSGDVSMSVYLDGKALAEGSKVSAGQKQTCCLQPDQRQPQCVCAA